MSDTTNYVRVQPAEETYDPQEMVNRLEGLHGNRISESSGLLGSMGSGKKPTYELLALTRGDGPVEIYYGVEEGEFQAFRSTLEEVYPASFEFTEVDLDPIKSVISPVEFSPEQFRDAVKGGDLVADLSLGGEDDVDEEVLNELRDEVTGEALQLYEDVDGELNPPRHLSEKGHMCEIDGPTLTYDGTVLARLDTDSVDLNGRRWRGKGERKKDWMTSLKEFSTLAAASEQRRVNEDPIMRTVPFSSVVSRLHSASSPVAIQILFEEKEKWRASKHAREERLKRENEDIFKRHFQAVGKKDESAFDKKDISELPQHVADRVEALDGSNPSKSFSMTVRAFAPSPPESDGYEQIQEQDPDDVLTMLKGLFSETNGHYYKIDDERWGDLAKMFSGKAKRKETKRYRERRLDYDNGKAHPDIVVDADELASFIALPPLTKLTDEQKRSIRGTSSERTPLPCPDPSEFSSFRDGMVIGTPLAENKEPLDEPVALSGDHLTTHTARYGASGAGKSIATMKEVATRHETTDGPTIVMEPKGDTWSEEYAQIHYKQSGDLDDLTYLSLPEDIPAIPLFDIRPALSDGRNRETAVQEVIEHFNEIAGLIMGHESFESAANSKLILEMLIQALFDPEHGKDAFTLDELFKVAQEMRDQKKIPEVSTENPQLEERLHGFLEEDDEMFDAVMGGVTNRLSQFNKSPHVAEIMNTLPDWDYDHGWYEDGLDFGRLMQEDRVVILETGDLPKESRAAVTTLVLSKLWQSIQSRRQRSAGEMNQIGMVIEEAAPIAAQELVYGELLPKGRSFGISLSLIMQFPGQVKNEKPGLDEGKRAYDELFNNVGTIISGRNKVSDALAGVFAGGEYSPDDIQRHLKRLPKGEWLAALPSDKFGGTVPAPFSMVSGDIPLGHPESDDPLYGDQKQQFDDLLQQANRRGRQRCCAEDSGMGTVDDKPFSSEQHYVPNDGAARDPGRTGTASGNAPGVNSVGGSTGVDGEADSLSQDPESPGADKAPFGGHAAGSESGEKHEQAATEEVDSHEDGVSHSDSNDGEEETDSQSENELTVETIGDGEVVVDPPEMTVSSLTVEYSADQSVELKAQAGEGYRFTGWEGDLGSQDADLTTIGVRMSRPRSITATFQPTSGGTSSGSGGDTEGSHPGDDEQPTEIGWKTEEASSDNDDWEGDSDQDESPAEDSGSVFSDEDDDESIFGDGGVEQNSSSTSSSSLDSSSQGTVPLDSQSDGTPDDESSDADHDLNLEQMSRAEQLEKAPYTLDDVEWILAKIEKIRNDENDSFESGSEQEFVEEHRGRLADEEYQEVCRRAGLTDGSQDSKAEPDSGGTVSEEDPQQEVGAGSTESVAEQAHDGAQEEQSGDDETGEPTLGSDTADEQATLSVVSEDGGQVCVSPPGTVAETIEESYESETTVTVAAMPDGDVEFSGWSGMDAPDGDHSPHLHLDIEEDSNLVARFEQPDSSSAGASINDIDHEVSEDAPSHSDQEVGAGQPARTEIGTKNESGSEKAIQEDSNPSESVSSSSDSESGAASHSDVTPTSAGGGIEDVVDPEDAPGTPKIPQDSESEGEFEDPLAPDGDDPSASPTGDTEGSSEQEAPGKPSAEDGEFSPDERMLLEGILMMMNREHPDFTLAEEGMEELVNRADVDVDELIDEGYIEKHGLFGRWGRDYYTVLEKGREHLKRDLKWKQGTDQQEADVRTPRVVTHEMAKQWLKEDCQVEEWYSTENGPVDLVGFANGEIECSVGIREKEPDEDPVKMYQRLKNIPGESVWIYRQSGAIQDDILALESAGFIEATNSSWKVDDVRRSLEQQDSEGISYLYTLQDIKDILTSE